MINKKLISGSNHQVWQGFSSDEVRTGAKFWVQKISSIQVDTRISQELSEVNLDVKFGEKVLDSVRTKENFIYYKINYVQMRVDASKV